MGGGHATSSLESQHYSVQNNKLYAFLVIVQRGGGAARGSETSKLMNRYRGPTCPSKVEENDMLESDRLKAVTNLQKYQEEIRAWRNPKVKLREFDVGSLVLLRSPRTENISKFEAKWIGLYVVIDKTRPNTYRLSDPQGRVLQHSWNIENLCRFLFKSKL
jgi:hypothetical protein